MPRTRPRCSENCSRNGWGDSWRNGIYGLPALSLAHPKCSASRRPRARAIGGDKGRSSTSRPAMSRCIPAGTGHQRLMGARTFSWSAPIRRRGTYDECTGKPDEHASALKTIPKVAKPKADPVYGKNGPLMDLWR